MARDDIGPAEVAEAVWRVLAADGFAGLTLRAVAGELGATTGLVMHRFPSKHALTAFALDLLEQRTEQDRGSDGPHAPEAVRDALVATLPLTPQAVASNRVWIASWDAALARPDLREDHAERYARGRERLRRLLGPHGDPDPAETADLLQSLALGIIVQAVLDPAAYPPDRQLRLVDRALEALRPRP